VSSAVALATRGSSISGNTTGASRFRAVSIARSSADIGFPSGRVKGGTELPIRQGRRGADVPRKPGKADRICGFAERNVWESCRAEENGRKAGFSEITCRENREIRE
jgi:hypothetical protein